MKKLLPILVSICMVFSIFSFTVFAEAQSGECGENLTWSLDENFVLTISGEGDMPDYIWSDNVPWYFEKDSIKSVVIEDGVTSVGTDSFYNCSSIESVTIPDSVTSIGTRAFYRCNSLSTLTIGSSVESIGVFAFYACDITSVTLPDSVYYVGEYAFYACESLSEINVSENNMYYSSLDGVLFSKDKTDIVCYPVGKVAAEYVIPDTVTSIQGELFKKTAIESVTIPDSVKSIGEYAFHKCNNLSTVTIGDSVTSIGIRAFYDCPNLKEITIPASVVSVEYNALGYYGDEQLKVENFTITGVKGSAAEAYATENGFTFIALDVTKLPENDFYMDEEASNMPNIVENTNASDIISTLGEYGITATITDKDGNAVENNATVGTGCLVTTSDGKEFTVIVNGDVDGNGTITSTDYLHIKHSLTGTKLSGCYKTAADTDGNDTISATDYLTVKAYLIGKAELYK